MGKRGQGTFILENTRDISTEYSMWILFGCWFEQTKNKKKSWDNQENLNMPEYFIILTNCCSV